MMNFSKNLNDYYAEQILNEYIKHFHDIISVKIFSYKLVSVTLVYTN